MTRNTNLRPIGKKKPRRLQDLEDSLFHDGRDTCLWITEHAFVAHMDTDPEDDDEVYQLWFELDLIRHGGGGSDGDDDGACSHLFVYGRQDQVDDAVQCLDILFGWKDDYFEQAHLHYFEEEDKDVWQAANCPLSSDLLEKFLTQQSQCQHCFAFVPTKISLKLSFHTVGN